jgi:hypothetical protein
MSLMIRSVSAVALSILLSAGSLAQGTVTAPPGGEAKGSPSVGGTNSGVGPTTTDPTQVDKGQNMILPSAGNSGPSAAPTMVYDCEKKPQDCTEPATPADKAAASQKKAIKP